MTIEAWTETTLGAVVVEPAGLQTGPFGTQLRAAEYLKGEDRASGDGIEVIMPRDLSANRISTESIARVSPAKAAELERYRLRPGDVVFSRRGKVGRCVLIEAAEEGWLVGTGCLRARLGPEVDPEFLIQYLRRPEIQSWLQRNAVGQTMKNLSTKILAALPLRLPPLREQRYVAEILGSVDASIRSKRQVIEQRQKVAVGSVQQLLLRGLEPGPVRSTAIGEIPDHWRLLTIGELCTLINGKGFRAVDRSTSGLPIIRIQNLNGSRNFNYYAGEPRPSWIVEPGELLFAWSGTRGQSIGPCLWPGPRGVLNQHIYRVLPREGVVKGWLYETLKLVTRTIERRAQGFKASLLHIRKADITDQCVAVPPYEEQLALTERAAVFVEMDRAENLYVDGLIKLKEALMQDLFTGRVNVARVLAHRASRLQRSP